MINADLNFDLRLQMAKGFPLSSSSTKAQEGNANHTFTSPEWCASFEDLSSDFSRAFGNPVLYTNYSVLIAASFSNQPADFGTLSIPDELLSVGTSPVTIRKTNLVKVLNSHDRIARMCFCVILSRSVCKDEYSVTGNAFEIASLDVSTCDY